MAATGAMADFARLSPQKKVMVFVAIGMLLGLVYHRFAYKPLQADLDQARQDNTQRAQLNRKLADDLVKYEELKLRMKQLDQIIKENQKALPTEAEVPAFFETLERKVKESGVDIMKWQKLAEAPFESFVKVPVEIELSGTFMQIKRFFASLVQKGIVTVDGAGGHVEERERVISIENLSLTLPVVVSREIRLTAKFTAVTFRQEDAAATAAPVGGAPVAPAAPAATPTAPPLPSAGTPSGAKARTERALDQGAAVNRAATSAAEGTGAGAGSARLKGGL